MDVCLEVKTFRKHKHTISQHISRVEKSPDCVIEKRLYERVNVKRSFQGPVLPFAVFRSVNACVCNTWIMLFQKIVKQKPVAFVVLSVSYVSQLAQAS